MQKYIRRLVLIGYLEDRARSICEDFVKDFPFIELECFVSSMEKSHVDRV